MKKCKRKPLTEIETGAGGREFKVVVEYDAVGQPVIHRRVQDVLEQLHRKGLIDDDCYNIGRIFQDNFTIAHLDRLQAFDIGRPSLSKQKGIQDCLEGYIDHLESARKKVHETIDLLGGIGSPMGTVVWHVLGLGETLEQFVKVRSTANFYRAQGVLIAALWLLTNESSEFRRMCK
ncbi:MAG: hypothetical protein HQL74_11060 [Magnetococcales bacterium]|nr:hypothetical protein [Magnetococcales bacterium]